MYPDIVIVRDGEGYRLLHGHLRLATALDESDEIEVDVRGEGSVKLMRTPGGYVVDRHDQRVPLRRK